jgi:hypothetical protein
MDPHIGAWPALPIAAWRDTRDTLHMWTQIVGKIQLALCPPLNHWWHVALHPYPRGLTTAPIPHGDRVFAIRFDFIGHELAVEASDGHREAIPLRPISVAGMYREIMTALQVLGISPRVSTRPAEVERPIPFELDTEHAAYDPEYASRFGAVVLQSHRVLEEYRGRFVGRSSPVHFFWGGFDLAVTRFSGRRAPLHPPVPFIPDEVVREGYSHEVMSVGFWPGGGPFDACYYAYAYPEPPGFRDVTLLPSQAHFEAALGEFVLPYEAVRCAMDPDATILAFAETAYSAAAELGRWDRGALERRFAA